MSKILAVDDKQDNLVAINGLLKSLIPDCNVIIADSGEVGIEKAKAELPDTILLDIKMPGMDGFEVCQKLKSDEKTKHIPVIMLTAIKTDSKNRVKGLELGADAFLSKPIDETELAAQVKVMLRIKKAEDVLRESEENLRKENIYLKSTIKDRYKFGSIVGKSRAMQKVYELILQATASDANVIIYGESGTGKELVAQTIHKTSARCHEEFVAVNCGAIPENLFENEFFGHREGAFTGAHIDKSGFLDLAHRGTLFLDEVGELNRNMQVKLLRAIESGEYIPVGDNKAKKADIRIIAATNRNLTDQIQKGLMREDFFYRLHVIAVNVPPLRDRKEDIPLLVEHFLKAYNADIKLASLPGKVREILSNYDWPGNVRELQNVLQRYLALGDLDLMSHPGFRQIDAVKPVNSEMEEIPDLRTAMQSYEKRLIFQALEKNQWHKVKTASELGLPPRTFFRKLQKLGLSPESSPA